MFLSILIFYLILLELYQLQTKINKNKQYHTLTLCSSLSLHLWLYFLKDFEFIKKIKR